MKKELNIRGMHCPACKALIEDVCSDYDEIESAVVVLKKETLSITANNSLDLRVLQSEIESIGPYKIE